VARLVDFLNDLGIAIHFKDLELEDTHVLEPKWVTEAVYKIINSEKLAKCNVVLKVNLLDEILKQKDEEDYFYPPDKYRYIIELMKKFELCYKLDTKQVLIPDLLEVEERTFDFDYDTSLKFIIEYDFLPKSVMPRFIVRMHKDIKKGLQWRTGVVLEDKAFHSTAVVKSDERDRKIYIFVNGEQKRYYFSTIRKTLRDINELLFLCGNIKQFDNKAALMEIAVSGEFKGIKIGESDLRAKLLTTLASYKIAGTCKFWIEQLLDNSNKRYANPAFYALKDYPAKLYEHISVFIDKYKGEAELVLGIMSLLNEYGKKAVAKRFRSIEAKLSIEQKEAINEAFNKANYESVYKLDLKPEKANIEPGYKISVPSGTICRHAACHLRRGCLQENLRCR
jgi:hypothetical protein